jgi:DNA-binding transcriptional MerR regulator
MRLKVGELARRTGLTVRTLHHYDEIGLLAPSERSDSGYRLYSQADVQRLHAIQALRHMGLPLAHIGELLGDDQLDPQHVLSQQIHALDVQIQQATELRGRLALMRDGMVAGSAPDMGNWLETLALMSTYGKYFSAAELKRIFERWPLIEGEWRPLIVQVDAAMRQGLPIDDPAVQKLTHRWMVLILEWMGGDMDLLDRWGHMYRQEPSTHSINFAPSGAMMAYVEQTIALRMQVLQRHFTRAEMAQLGFVSLTHWQALEDEVTALLARGEDPTSPAARAAVAHWSRLMDQLCGHRPALRAKLLHAWTTEPLLQSSALLSPAVRAFIGHAAALPPPPQPPHTALDPHAT